jgi:hypothetical protein
MRAMQCTLCGQRRAKRACPALRQDICPVCCATKRLVEIRCPADCVHLTAARQHPAAAVKRQHDADLRTLMTALGPMSEGQLQLYFLLQSYLLRTPADGFARPVDAEVVDAANAVAATLETASRGVIFEHRAETVNGQRLAGELREVLQKAGKGGGSRFEREAAAVLRSVAAAAGQPAGKPAGSRAYLELVARVLREGAPEPPAPVQPSIILP